MFPVFSLRLEKKTFNHSCAPFIISLQLFSHISLNILGVFHLRSIPGTRSPYNSCLVKAHTAQIIVVLLRSGGDGTLTVLRESTTGREGSRAGVDLCGCG